MPKKLTHDEYVKRVEEINPDIEVLGEYINSQTKILHRCKIDGYEWYAKPNTILNGKGCAMCYGNIKKTHEKYVKEVAEINPNIEVIGKYVNANTKILHRCKIDGHEWMARPYGILSGQGCPKCGGHILKTHEQYVKELLTINPNIEVVGKYINSHTKILHRCKIDGYEWMVQPNDILQGYGCPRCAGNERYGHEEYVRRVAEINSDIEVIGFYINNQTKILHKCKIDGHEWMATPNHILHNSGCPMCSANAKKLHEQYVLEVKSLNPNIEVLGLYDGAFTKISHKCKICGYEWSSFPNNILCGCGCPKCKESHGERNIGKWLDRYDILYQRQKTFDDCKNKRLLPFDFYLPDYNVLIEYNGKQHYEPVAYFGGIKNFEGIVERDKIKEEYCKQNNIPLFKIPYFANIDEELERLYHFIIKNKNVEKGVVM